MLSNDEFVTQSKVVRQHGMLAFLHDLNRRGWGAVNDLTRVHHSTGGLAGIPAPSAPNLPSINLAPMENTNSTTVQKRSKANIEGSMSALSFVLNCYKIRYYILN